jgi:hypothetical protein
MFRGVALNTEYYDAMLASWSKLSLQNGVTFDAGNSQYTNCMQDEKDFIINTFGWTITDGGSVPDTIKPVPDVTNLPDIVSECKITSLTAPTATDNCAGTITGTTTDPTQYTEQGYYTVTWIYDDGNGNTSMQTQNIVIEDVTDPSISCSGDQIVTADETNYYTVPGSEFDPAEVSDNCAVASIINDYNYSTTLQDAEFPVGTTTVTWTVTDSAGNTNSCSFNVVVNSSATGISELSAAGLSVYPNPVCSVLTIKSSRNKINIIEVTDLSGKPVLKRKIENHNARIDLSNLSNGVYMLSIITPEKKIITKIVKK